MLSPHGAPLKDAGLDVFTLAATGQNDRARVHDLYRLVVAADLAPSLHPLRDVLADYSALANDEALRGEGHLRTLRPSWRVRNMRNVTMRRIMRVHL